MGLMVQRVSYRKVSLIVGLLLLLVAVVGQFTVTLIMRYEAGELREKLNGTVDVSINGLINWAHHQKHVIEMAADHPKVVGFVEKHIADHHGSSKPQPHDGHYDDSRSIIKLLESLIHEEGYIGFSIFTPDMRRILDYREGTTYKVLPAYSHPYAKRALSGETFISPPTLFDTRDRYWPMYLPKNIPSLFTLSPIKDSEGKVIAAISFHLSPYKGWTSVVSSARYGSSAKIYLVDRNGAMISESRFLDDLKGLGLVLEGRNSAIGITVKPPPVADGHAPSLTVAARSLSQNMRGHSVLSPYPDYRGVSVVGSWRWIEELGVGVISELDYKDGFSWVLRIQKIYWSTVIVTALLVLLFISYFYVTTQFLEKGVQHERLRRLKAEQDWEIARHDSTHDLLTALPNRILFVEIGRQILKRASRAGYPACLLFMDLDRFKLVNDVYGHIVGDRVLKEAAHRMGREVRESDVLCRWGGDEFLMLLENCGPNKKVSELANKIISSVSAPYYINELELEIGLTIGIGCFPVDGHWVNDLIRHADVAMYNAKKQYRGTHNFFNKEMLVENKASLETEKSLLFRHAMTEAEKQRNDLLLQVIESLSLAIDQRDSYTANHQKRVSDVAVNIASDLGLSASQIEGVRFGGLLHDIGKNGIPTEVLHKVTALSEHDLAVMHEHPMSGFRILEGINFPWPIADIVLQHQERLDGSGYPYGLKGDEILLEARILAVADTIDAMTSDRPYRPALELEVALSELREKRGILYDADVVDAAIRVCEKMNGISA